LKKRVEPKNFMRKLRFLDFSLLHVYFLKCFSKENSCHKEKEGKQTKKIFNRVLKTLR